MGSIAMATTAPNIYLAARYSRRAEMCDYAQELRVMGCQITSRWIEGAHDFEGYDAGETSALMPQWACEDWLDVKSADLVLSFTEDPGRPAGRGRGGRHTEYGLALAWNTPCWVIGPREHIFHWLPQVQVFATWGEVVAHLRLILGHGAAKEHCHGD